MIVARHVPHEDAYLAVVDFASVATPLALDPHRMRPALGKAARIKGDDPIGFTQPMHHLPDQHLDQRAMVPWCRTDKLLQDQALDIDQGRNVLGVFAVQVRQEPFQVEVQAFR